MASDKITEIVDQSAFAQVDKLKLDLKALTDQFVQLFGGVEQFKKALATASTGGGLSGGIGKVASQMTELEKATKALVIAEERLAIIDHDIVQKKREVQLELKKEEQARKEATKAMQAEEGSYNQMDATLKKLTAQYKAMGTANMQAFGKDKLAEIQKYEAALQSLDKGMGKFNRNVGNYQNQTFQLSQVFREIPAFTYSATTGILALSNNLPMLADGFKQVATATNDATGKVNGTMGALKIFAKSIFSWTNAFTIAIGLITIFSKEIMDFISGSDKAADTLKKMEDAAGGAMGEMFKLNSTLTAFTKGTATEKELLDEYNDTLGKTAGYTNDWKVAKQNILKQQQSYIDFLVLEAEATEVLALAVEKATRAQKIRQNGLSFYGTLKGQINNAITNFKKTMSPASFIAGMFEDPETIEKLVQEQADAEAKIYKDKSDALQAKLQAMRASPLDTNKLNVAKQQKPDYIPPAIYVAKYEQENLVAPHMITLEEIYDADKGNEQAIYHMKLAFAELNKEIGDKELSDEEARNLNELLMNRRKSQAILDEEKKLKDAKSELRDSFIEASYSIATSVNEAIFIKEMNALQAKEDALSEYYKNELRFIEQSGLSSINKEKEKQKLEAQTEAQRKKIDAERKRAQYKAAQTQKVLDTTSIISSTAIAVMSALGAKPYTPANIALAAAAGLTGAAQLTKVLATPLPQYAEGTEHHKGGSFIAGEKGVEQVILPSGKSFLTPDSATLFPDMPQGTKVINNKELMQQVYNSAMVKLSTQGSVNANNYAKAQLEALDEVVEKINKLNSTLERKELSATFNDYAGFRNYKNSNIR